MVDRRCQLRLAQELLAERGVRGQPGGHHLERDPTLQADVLSQIDRTHPAVAEQRLHAEPGDDGSHTEVVRDPHLRTSLPGGWPNVRPDAAHGRTRSIA
jgi:hypothetical protein